MAMRVEEAPRDLRGTDRLVDLYQRERSRADLLEDSMTMGVLALSGAIAARDATTAEHSERVVHLALSVLRRMDWREAARRSTEWGFMLHDVGKIAVPDSILLKPGPLTAGEAAVMRRHPVLGVQVLERIPCFADERVIRVVRHHHERWDGLGYPDRLSGSDIPVACRAFAVVDTFDAMTSDRPYRGALPTAVAVEEIALGSGTQFDPKAVEAFLDIIS